MRKNNLESISQKHTLKKSGRKSIKIINYIWLIFTVIGFCITMVITIEDISFIMAPICYIIISIPSIVYLLKNKKSYEEKELIKKEKEYIESVKKEETQLELQILNTPKQVNGKYIYTFNKMMSYENSVIIDGNWIEIIRSKGIVNTLNHGLDGTKKIHIKHISGVQLKEASNVTNGYIQFLVVGSQESKGGLISAAQDENTIMFIKKYSDLAKKLVKEVQDKIEQVDKNPSVAIHTSLSIAQQIKEFKELLDEGIITQEEFDMKKSELLKK